MGEPTSRLSSRYRLAAAAAVLVLLAAACGDDGEATEEDAASDSGETTEPAETTTTEAEVTTTTVDPDQEVIDAYQAANDALAAAYDPPDPDHPDLLATRAGESLSNFQDGIRDYEARGVSVVGPPIEVSATVTSLVGETAVLQACVRELTTEVDTETGEALGEEQETIFHLDVTMERIGDTWKVVSQEEVEEECTPE